AASWLEVQPPGGGPARQVDKGRIQWGYPVAGGIDAIGVDAIETELGDIGNLAVLAERNPVRFRPGLARRERCPGVLICVERFAQPAICLDTVQRERTACVGNRAGQFAARVE